MCSFCAPRLGRLSPGLPATPVPGEARPRQRWPSGPACLRTRRRDGGTGRRSGLKLRRPHGRAGSTPAPGTNRGAKAGASSTKPESSRAVPDHLEKDRFDVLTLLEAAGIDHRPADGGTPSARAERQPSASFERDKQRLSASQRDPHPARRPSGPTRTSRASHRMQAARLDGLSPVTLRHEPRAWCEAGERAHEPAGARTRRSLITEQQRREENVTGHVTKKPSPVVECRRRSTEGVSAVFGPRGALDLTESLILAQNER
jgi:hypothetical protein